MAMEKNQITSSGVEQLIEKLRQEGVVAGQEKARDIVTDAQKRAEWIVGEAKQEAQMIRDQAKADAEATHAAAEDALKLAMRDALLKLNDTLLGSFSDEVMRVVGEQMIDPAFVQRLILALAGRIRDEAGMDDEKQLLIRLPADAVGIDELKSNPEELKQGSLTQLAASIAADLLRKGVRYEVSEHLHKGISVQLVGKQMTVDFTDEAVAALLLQHLQPRFRALLQGIVR